MSHRSLASTARQDEACRPQVETPSDTENERQQHQECNEELRAKLRLLADQEQSLDDLGQVRWGRDGCPRDVAPSDVVELCQDMNRRYALGEDLTQCSLPSCCFWMDERSVRSDSSAFEGDDCDELDLDDLPGETVAREELGSCEKSLPKATAHCSRREGLQCEALENPLSDILEALPGLRANDGEDVAAVAPLWSALPAPSDALGPLSASVVAEASDGDSPGCSSTEAGGVIDARQEWLERKQRRKARMAARTSISYGAFLRCTL